MSEEIIQRNFSFCLKIIMFSRSVTKNLRFKIDNCPDKGYYESFKVGVDKLCHECYMKIVDFYRRQISTITRNIEVNNSMETDLIEINNLAETSESNISTNL
ncbi:26020_t:CDS:1, partial [Dentiscutata erythropus]